MKFRISHKPSVPQQIHALHELAKKAGIEPDFVHALKEMIRRLQKRPLEWGDPEYRLHHKGSIVCHGIVDPLLVRFAVFEVDEVVHILEIKPLPHSPLSNG